MTTFWWKYEAYAPELIKIVVSKLLMDIRLQYCAANRTHQPKHKGQFGQNACLGLMTARQYFKRKEAWELKL